MVGVTKIQRGNANYWLAAVAEGGEDYYTKPGEAPGEWVGSLAAHLGLEGEVDPEGYAAILEGRDPTSGETLVQRPETRYRERPDGSQKLIEPVLGYDVRFSAPKSVSLLYALGSETTRERIVKLMHAAVEQGIAHLEAEACKVQRGKGGKRIEEGQGFVGMAFRHRMSRAGDPALHVHVLISNMTRAAEDGKWLSLASPEGRSALYPFGKSAGVVFQAALRAGFLREFGLEFEAVKNGYADLKGFSRELIEAFSTRAREIREWMTEHGASGVAAAQTAAYRTRAAKDFDVDADQRVTEWEAHAAPFGFSGRSTEEMVGEAAPREPLVIGDEILAAAARELESECSYFDGRELLWSIANQLPEGADLGSLLAARERLLQSGRVVQVHESLGPLDPYAYSTPAIVKAERTLVDGALAGTNAGVGVVDRVDVDRVLVEHGYLGHDQREMVLRLTTGGERVVAVTARPGTGKTTALEATVEAWKAAEIPLIGCATARMATGELKDANVAPATTVTSLRNHVDRLRRRGKCLAAGTVVVVDEANVTDTFDLAYLYGAVVECGGKLVLIGDHRQIGSVGPGGLFAYLVRVLDPVRLTTIRRQALESDQRIVALVHEARGSEALDLLRGNDKLIVGDNLIETLYGLALDWYRDYATGADVVMIARRNRDVDFLNDRAREFLAERGRLGRAKIMVGEHQIARGDRVMTRINSRETDNRERWDVISVNPLTRTVKLRRVGGDERVVKLGRDYLKRTTPDGDPALLYAYAITKFGAESKTFDRAYPLLDSTANLNEELVAISRGREIANAYTVASSDLLDPDLSPARRELSDTLQDLRRSIELDDAEFPALEVSVQRQVNDLPLGALARRRAELVAAARATDPETQRRDRLEREIQRDREWVETLAKEREATERLPAPPPEDLARLRAAETSTAERLRLNNAEMEALPEPVSGDAAPAAPAERLEAALIAQRIEREISKETTIARAGESEVVFGALGCYPEDPGLAAQWDRAAYSLLSYRLRHDVSDERNALGPDAKTPAARAERAAADRRLQEARRSLGLSQEMTAERTASRVREIGR